MHLNNNISFMYIYPFFFSLTTFISTIVNHLIHSFAYDSIAKQLLKTEKNRQILRSFRVDLINLDNSCIAKETSMAIEEMPWYAAKARYVRARYELRICITCITDAAHAIVSHCFCLESNSSNCPWFGGTRN